MFVQPKIKTKTVLATSSVQCNLLFSSLDGFSCQ